eukprot:m.87749 g.87749  ORF g.87749 m.87749 type:complete len:296 (+) comp14516_c0_seq2:162-1049(+)
MSATMEELQARHRKELRELQAKITALKKSAPKGDKKKKKEITAEIALLEAQTAERHEQELKALEKELASCSSTTTTTAAAETELTEEGKPEAVGNGGDEDDVDAGDAQQRKSRAQKRRDKKAQEVRDRQRRIEEAEPETGTTKKEIEEAAIARMLSALKMHIRQVPADGNCLFTSIQVQLPEQFDYSAVDLRKLAANHMKSHADDYLPFMTTDDGDIMTSEQFDQYCEKMATTSDWGGQCEIRALAEALNVKIEVYQADAPKQVIGPESSDQSIRLSYHRHQYGLGEHYNAVMST